MAKMRTAIVCGELRTAPEGDYFVACSFDSNHVILRSRLPYHIIKCVKNHPGHNKVQCPYDSTEYIDRDEFPNHLLSCESKRSAYAEKFELAWLKATGSMCDVSPTPYFHEGAPKVDEDWGGSLPVEKNIDFSALSLEEEKIQDVLDEIEEELEEDYIPIGRGVSHKKCHAKQKTGIGRAELIRNMKKYCENQKAMARGTSFNTPLPNRGVGRGDYIKHIIGQEETAQLGAISDSLNSNNKESFVNPSPTKGKGRGETLKNFLRQDQNIQSSSSSESLNSSEKDSSIRNMLVETSVPKNGIGRGERIQNIFRHDEDLQSVKSLSSNESETSARDLSFRTPVSTKSTGRGNTLKTLFGQEAKPQLSSSTHSLNSNGKESVPDVSLRTPLLIGLGRGERLRHILTPKPSSIDTNSSNSSDKELSKKVFNGQFEDA